MTKIEQLQTIITPEELLAIIYSYSGERLYIPSEKTVMRKIRNYRIIKDFYTTTLTVKELGLKYNLSSRQIYRILKDRRKYGEV